MQFYPINPTLNAPGTQRLKLQYDEVLSSFAFNFNLRRYNSADYDMSDIFFTYTLAGAYTRPVPSST